MERLLARLGESDSRGRFIALVGPSGSGKSSVVNAGLLPALRGGALRGSGDWFVAEISPGPHPFEELEAALLRIAVNPPPSLLDQLLDGDDRDTPGGEAGASRPTLAPAAGHRPVRGAVHPGADSDGQRLPRRARRRRRRPAQPAPSAGDTARRLLRPPTPPPGSRRAAAARDRGDHAALPARSREGRHRTGRAGRGDVRAGPGRPGRRRRRRAPRGTPAAPVRPHRTLRAAPWIGHRAVRLPRHRRSGRRPRPPRRSHLPRIRGRGEGRDPSGATAAGHAG